jgi:hypothetical protein
VSAQLEFDGKTSPKASFQGRAGSAPVCKINEAFGEAALGETEKHLESSPINLSSQNSPASITHHHARSRGASAKAASDAKAGMPAGPAVPRASSRNVRSKAESSSQLLMLDASVVADSTEISAASRSACALGGGGPPPSKLVPRSAVSSSAAPSANSSQRAHS